MALYPYTPFEKVEYPCYWLAHNGTFWSNNVAKNLSNQQENPETVHFILQTAQKKHVVASTPFSLPLPGGGTLTIVPLAEGLLATAGNETLLSTSLVGSHLREQLTSIFAILPLLARKVDESGLPYTEEIQNICYSLLRLASNLENSASLDPNPSLNRPLDFSVLVASLMQSVLTICQQQNILLEVDIPETPLPVRGDERLLAEAILNILRNSMQYTRDGNRIRVRLFEAGGKAVLTVQDRGIGIKPEHLLHVFNPYFSADPYGDGAPPPGAGLGLTVAYRVASNLGGTINIESKFGEGTRASIALPLDYDGDDVLGSDAADYLMSRYSPVYVQLSGYCRFPDF